MLALRPLDCRGSLTGVQLPALAVHVKIVRIEQAGIHQPLQARHRQRLSLQHNEPGVAQLLKRAVDVNLGKSRRICKIGLRQWKLAAGVISQAAQPQAEEELA